jgi:type IX secretion system PorP/SprF family membrane protein
MRQSGLRTIIAVLFVMVFADLYAQQKPVLSQYMFNGLVLNPAYAGRHEYTTFTAMYRDQWINVPGAPQLTTFAAHSGIKDRNVGIGLVMSEDRIGVHSNISLYATYAYILRLNTGARLSLGLQGGADFLRSNWSDLTLDDVNDPLLTGSERNLFPNFGTGFYYYTDKFYFGFSIPYILASRKTQENDLFRDVRHSRNYYLTGGHIFDVSPRLKIKPSALIRIEDNMPLAFDLNANIYFDEVIDIGLSYRSGDSVIGILGLQVNKYLKFSYAYDYTISDLNNYTKGSHELMLQYRINFSAPRHHRMCPQPMYF